MASSVKQHVDRARHEVKSSASQKADVTMQSGLKRKADGNKNHESGQVAKKAKPSAPAANMKVMPSFNDLLSIASQVSKQGAGSSPILTNAALVTKSTKDKKPDGTLMSQEEKDRLEFLNSPEYRHWKEHGGPMPSREKVLSRYKQHAADVAKKAKASTVKHSASTTSSHSSHSKQQNKTPLVLDKSKQNKVAASSQLSKTGINFKGNKEIVQNGKDLNKSSVSSKSVSTSMVSKNGSKNSNGEHSKLQTSKDMKSRDSGLSKSSKSISSAGFSTESSKKTPSVDLKKSTVSQSPNLSKSESDRKASAILNKMAQMGLTVSKTNSAEILQRVQRHMERMREESNKKMGSIPQKVTIVPKGGRGESNSQLSSKSGSSSSAMASSGRVAAKPEPKASSSYGDGKKLSKSTPQADSKKSQQARSSSHGNGASSNRKYVQVSETVVQCKPAQPASTAASKLTGIRAQFADDRLSTWDQINQRFPHLAGKRRPVPEEDSDQSEYEEDDDDSMDDFIDDGNDDDYGSDRREENNIEKAIREIFGYDRRKYANERLDDLRDMESSFSQQQKEENRSARLGRQEDLEDMRREEEELQRKKMKKK